MEKGLWKRSSEKRDHGKGVLKKGILERDLEEGSWKGFTEKESWKGFMEKESWEGIMESDPGK